jgi:hypothetical protein
MKIGALTTYLARSGSINLHLMPHAGEKIVRLRPDDNRKGIAATAASRAAERHRLAMRREPGHPGSGLAGDRQPIEPGGSKSWHVRRPERW